MGWLQNRRRHRLDNEPFPDEWERILKQHITVYHQVSDSQKKNLQKLIRYFIAEKSFEGCGGMDVDDTVKVSIAAMACIPLLGGVSDLYPYLTAILVYPDKYQAKYIDAGEDGVVSEGVESRLGESWDQGVIVLSWKEVTYDIRHPDDGSNVVLHECAHQLDYEWGATMGGFSWKQDDNNSGMAATLKNEYQKYILSLEKNRNRVIDDYAATDIHEFFAVMTEAWFEQPDIISGNFPHIDRIFSDFYNLVPDFRK